jgi:hypothetical protein
MALTIGTNGRGMNDVMNPYHSMQPEFRPNYPTRGRAGGDPAPCLRFSTL